MNDIIMFGLHGLTFFALVETIIFLPKHHISPFMINNSVFGFVVGVLSKAIYNEFIKNYDLFMAHPYLIISCLSFYTIGILSVCAAIIVRSIKWSMKQ